MMGWWVVVVTAPIPAATRVAAQLHAVAMLREWSAAHAGSAQLALWNLRLGQPPASLAGACRGFTRGCV
jgi:hypothetical protein